MTGRRASWIFYGAVLLAGLIQVLCDFTPSSYGIFLEQIEAPEYGPAVGHARAIRSDEWSVSTPMFQAAVRNGFKRYNETSLYREDMRTFYALPLRDWALLFKPEVWAFFVAPPDIAYAIYWALFFCACLCGYHALFRELGADPWLAACASLIVYFCGYTQYIWTTYCPLLALYPWMLLIVLRPMRWWAKTLICLYAFPVFLLSHLYPTLLIALVWGGAAILWAAQGPAVFRWRQLAPVALGVAAAITVAAVYFHDVIPAMAHTQYPGKRVTYAGFLEPSIVLAQIFPFLSAWMGGYRSLIGLNIVEVGNLGSFLPLLTLCLMDFRKVSADRTLLRGLWALLGLFAGLTAWQALPVPQWIVHALRWDTGPAQRTMFTSGLMLTVASVMIWARGHISTSWRRIVAFLLAGPIFSVVLKFLLFPMDLWQYAWDLVLVALGLFGGLLALTGKAQRRGLTMLATVALINVFGFGRFNPLQSAAPIFYVPYSDVVIALNNEAQMSPGGVIADPRFMGSVLNGIGLKSVTHLLVVPQLAFFRKYFPTMPADRFDAVFDRYAHIMVSYDPLPWSTAADQIHVPIDVLTPPANNRRVEVGGNPATACAFPAGGAITSARSEGAALIIEGWAPWFKETAAQSLRIESPLPVQVDRLETVPRPDIAEEDHDYRYVKCGFRLRLSGRNRAPRLADLSLIAKGTSNGTVRVSGACQ
jgi:hypothetical protein